MRKLLAALAALLTSISLAGCIGNDPDPAVKANSLCATHGGVASFATDGGWLRPDEAGHAICKDGRVMEWGS